MVNPFMPVYLQYQMIILTIFFGQSWENIWKYMKAIFWLEHN